MSTETTITINEGAESKTVFTINASGEGEIYGEKFNSRERLYELLFDVMGINCNGTFEINVVDRKESFVTIQTPNSSLMFKYAGITQKGQDEIELPILPLDALDSMEALLLEVITGRKNIVMEITE